MSDDINKNPAPPVSNPAPEPEKPTQSAEVTFEQPVEAVSPDPAPEAIAPEPEIDPFLEEEEKLFAVADTDGPKNKVKRGEEVNISHKDPAMRQILIGVGWDLKAFESDPLDLDASIFLLNAQEKTRIDEDFIFYNNAQGGDNAVRHLGDNRTGAGDGDDEQIAVDLTTVPLDVATIVFVLSIYDEDYQNPDFSMVKNVYFRLVNKDRDHELFRYELDEELTGNAGLIIGRLERIGNEWVFRAVGETVEGGLGQIANNYDIIVAEDVQG